MYNFQLQNVSYDWNLSPKKKKKYKKRSPFAIINITYFYRICLQSTQLFKENELFQVVWTLSSVSHYKFRWNY